MKKIISLQTIDGFFYKYPNIRLGSLIGSDGLLEDDPKITKIEREYPGAKWGKSVYIVYTDDGHYRVLPADKYIAEYTEVEE